MQQLKFSTDLDESIRGVELVRIVAKASTRDRLPSGRHAVLDALLTERARKLVAGPRGKRELLVVGSPDLEWCVLPETPSRGLSPSGAEFASSLSEIPDRPQVALVVIAANRAEALPLVRAVVRRIPVLDFRTPSKIPTDVRVVALEADGTPIALTETEIAIAEDTREAARLVDDPPTSLNPERFAAIARELLDGTPVEIREIVGDELLREGCEAIHAVGRCALQAPRMFLATLGVGGGTGHPSVALVGKGVTYDTGGLHLKPRGGMEGMKSDMGGAAAALCAFRALARSGHRGLVHALLPMSENAIGPAALKPDDVLRMHSGQTVEINNTDAEGRLLLADAVSYASRAMGAEIVLDIATLTGAQLVATGKTFGAIVTADPELELLAREVGMAVGDPMHPLPYTPELHRIEFESPIADLRNSVKDRGNAQASCAGDFIGAQLEGTTARWCHFDIAGPATRNDRGTGAGVGLLAGMVQRLQGS